MTRDNRIGEIQNDRGVKDNGNVLEIKPLSKTPMTETVKMATPGALLKVEIVTVLKLTVVGFGFGIENVFEVGVSLGGIKIDKIVNQNVGHSEDKRSPVAGKKNSGNKKERNETIDTGLPEKGKGKSGSVRKIANSLNSGMTLFFGAGFKIGEKIVLDIKTYIANSIVETGGRLEAKIIIDNPN